MVVETEWMAAAETRMPTATKALAEREASMEGKWLNRASLDRSHKMTEPAHSTAEVAVA